MREFRDSKGLHPRDLSTRQRLLVLYAADIVGVVLVFTGLYYTGIRSVEGRDYSVFRAFQTVVETMTTTGYGADSPWETPAMNLLMVTMQVTGIVIGFVTLRVLVIPLFERTASIVLTALEVNEGLRVTSFVPSTRRTAALAAVGVDRSVAPHALIGRRLAGKATTPSRRSRPPAPKPDLGGATPAGGHDVSGPPVRPSQQHEHRQYLQPTGPHEKDHVQF